MRIEKRLSKTFRQFAGSGKAGGIAVPALIHFMMNGATPTQAGIGIPIARTLT